MWCCWRARSELVTTNAARFAFFCHKASGDGMKLTSAKLGSKGRICSKYEDCWGWGDRGGKGVLFFRVDERVDASRRSWAAFSNSCETSSSLDFALGCESSTLACREVFMNVWVELATKNANACSISIKKSIQRSLSNDILVHNLLPSHSVCLQMQNCVYLAQAQNAKTIPRISN